MNFEGRGSTANNALNILQNTAGKCSLDDENNIGCDLLPDPELIEEGWQWRFIADKRRAGEALQMYEELGFEVKLARVKVDNLNSACAGCKTVIEQFSAVYTRRKSSEH